MFTRFVALKFMALFDMGADGTAHPFPVKSRLKSLFKVCGYRVLQVVVVPSYCMILEVLGDDKFAILAKNFDTVDKFKGIFVCFFLFI